MGLETINKKPSVSSARFLVCLLVKVLQDLHCKNIVIASILRNTNSKWTVKIQMAKLELKKY
jgi:hypothetical protein